MSIFSIFEDQILSAQIMNNLSQFYLLFKESPEYLIPLVFFGILFLNHYMSSKVLVVTKAKKLMTQVNHRSSHQTPVPPFGGVSFFLIFMLLFAGLIGMGLDSSAGFLIIGISFIFISGIKDDLLASSAMMKLLTQFFGAALIIFLPELQFQSLHGALGIGSMPEWGFVIFKFYCVLFIINSFNLIDGIDGLAASVGIIVTTALIPVFWLGGDPLLAVVCSGIVAMLISFMRFNFSSRKFKLFMGDGGSLTLGYVLSFLILRAAAIGSTLPFTESWIPNNIGLYILVIFFLPILDTFRAIVIRIREGRKVYVADRNHIHHVLIDSGMSHKRATLVLASTNVLFIGIFVMADFYLNTFGMNLLLLSFFAISAIALRVIHNRNTSEVSKSRTWTRELAMVMRSLLP